MSDSEIALLEINKKLDRLLELHEKDCKKMSKHIDFIEKVYDNVKAPFTFIMDSIKTVIPSNQITTPLEEQNPRLEPPRIENLQRDFPFALEELLQE